MAITNITMQDVYCTIKEQHEELLVCGRQQRHGCETGSMCDFAQEKKGVASNWEL